MILRRLHPDAVVPERMHGAEDAGYDLCSLEDGFVPAGGHAVFGTGLAIQLTPGVAGLVLSRSGLAHRYGVAVLNAPGLIDPGYRGEIKVILHNASPRPHLVQQGDRIAQLLFTRFLTLDHDGSYAVLDSEELEASRRGTNGLGSTGRN